MKSEFTMTLLTELKYSLSGIKRRFIVSLHSEASSECVQWSNGYSIRHVFSKRIALFVIFGLWELDFFCTVLYIILINQLNRVQCCNRLLFLPYILWIRKIQCFLGKGTILHCLSAFWGQQYIHFWFSTVWFLTLSCSLLNDWIFLFT